MNEANVIVKQVSPEEIGILISARLDYLCEMLGERPESDRTALAGDLTEYFSQAMKEGTFLALRAEVNGETVSWGGMVFKTVPGDFTRSSYLEADILNMYTPPVYRRQGYSSLVLEHLLALAKEMGVSKVALHCSKSGEPLYRKYGFSDPQYPYLELIVS